MSDSILDDTKKIVGISASDTSFDLDLITHINSTFVILNQLGVGPTTGFVIEDRSDEWEDFTENAIILPMVKTYMGLKVRSVFDPPATSFLIDALKAQITEYEQRISIQREWELDPVDPKV